MAVIDPHTLASVFGILGTVVAFLVLLAPVPTFYSIIKKKSAEGFQSIPYSVALFSAMLMLYYAFLKTHAPLIMGINAFGSIIETVYLIIYLIYAPAKSRIFTAKLIVLFNVLAYALILCGTYQIPNHFLRLKLVGWINVVFNVCVFAAPLSIMRLVIRTQSVEFMSFPLSFSLTLCAVMWFFYGLLIKDFFVAAPNILGFSLGMAQMILYLVYKNAQKPVLPEYKLNEVPNKVAAANDDCPQPQTEADHHKNESKIITNDKEPSAESIV